EPLWLTDQPETVLAGVVDNDVATTSSVAWLRRGGPSGTATGTTLWTTPAVALPMGLSDFQVTATGSSYHAPYGGATTFNANLTVNRLPFVPDPGDTLIAINAAGAEYLAVDGTDYLADTAFEGGSTQVSTRNVANTEDDTLYNSWRWGNFAYRIPVSNGQYRVSLHFAETYNSAPGQRSFDVALQGVPILTAFDIAAEVGLDTATVRVFETTVSNNQLLIQFSNGSAGSARVDAVRIELAVEDLLVDGFETP
ncbi:MAG: malectin, partial [Xanthomonadales bacterium]|nr:malectin [Xanthomonadales bacterium]